MSAGRRGIRLTVGLACALWLGGCGAQSPLEPRSHAARDIADLWWWMLAAATVVFVGAVALLVLAWFRRRTPGLPVFGERESISIGFVLVFGMAIPAVALLALFLVSDIAVLPATQAPKVSSTALTIDVTGHQWFWEVRYPGTRAVTANEIHIPVGERVNVVARTGDVIHSFWVPQLNRKIDMIPGRSNRVLLYADRPGRYRGQCAEFCGFQHANMGIYVFAQRPADYRRWLANMSAPARSATTAPQRDGENVFATNCASCHTIRGTTAGGRIGPDLTHLQTRTTLAALTIPSGYLRRWVRDPQHYKPGNRMPAIGLSQAQRNSLMAYLRSLR